MPQTQQITSSQTQQESRQEARVQSEQQTNHHHEQQNQVQSGLEHQKLAEASKNKRQLAANIKQRL